MSGTTWTKFFWSDWETDQKLKLCTLAAQGLWMRLLCIAAAHDPIGYVSTTGDPLGVTDLARLTGASETEVETLLAELERNGVFSRDRKGRIYSRRMIADAKASATAKKNGKLGGNPNLGNYKGNPHRDNPRPKAGDKPQKPSASTRLEPQGSNPSMAKRFSNIEIRSKFVTEMGEEWTVSWLDQCSWRDIPVPAAIAPRELSAKKIRDALRRPALSGLCNVIVELAA